jgi:hypothetical protein
MKTVKWGDIVSHPTAFVSFYMSLMRRLRAKKQEENK